MRNNINRIVDNVGAFMLFILPGFLLFVPCLFNITYIIINNELKDNVGEVLLLGFCAFIGFLFLRSGIRDIREKNKSCKKTIMKEKIVEQNNIKEEIIEQQEIEEINEYEYKEKTNKELMSETNSEFASAIMSFVIDIILVTVGGVFYQQVDIYTKLIIVFALILVIIGFMSNIPIILSLLIKKRKIHYKYESDGYKYDRLIKMLKKVNKRPVLFGILLYIIIISIFVLV